MTAETVPWKLLAATVGVGVLTDGWNLAEAPHEEEPDPADVRKFSTDVSFASPFAAPPVVHLGLTGFDLEEHSSARLTLAAESITPFGFRVTIATWRASRVYAVEFSWLAVGA